MRKTIGVGVAAALLLALMALPAAAQDYPPDAPDCTLSATTVAPGGTVTVNCVGWLPNTAVTATLFPGGAVLGTLFTDEHGRLTAGFTIPADTAPGQYTLRLSGLNAQGVQTNVDLALTVAAPAAVTQPVTPPRVVPAPRLPRTGGDALLALGLAAGLLAAGGGALGAARRRNQAEISI